MKGMRLQKILYFMQRLGGIHFRRVRMMGFERRCMRFPRWSVCDFVLYPTQGTWLTNYVPFEKAYGIHHVIGAIVFGLSLAHGAAHVINLSLWTGWSFQVDHLFISFCRSTVLRVCSIPKAIECSI